MSKLKKMKVNIGVDGGALCAAVRLAVLSGEVTRDNIEQWVRGNVCRFVRTERAVIR